MGVVSVPVPVIQHDGELADWQRIALKIMLVILVALLVTVVVEAIRYNSEK